MIEDLLINGTIPRRKCKNLTRHRDLFRYIEFLLKNERIDEGIAKAIETDIRINGEMVTWAWLFDYGVKGKDLFLEVY